MDFEKTINEFIKILDQQEKEYLVKLSEIKIKKCGINELLQNYKQNQKLLITERVESIKPNSSKIMDDKDIKKVNLFFEYLDKVGDEPLTWKLIKQKMPKIEYYIYNKKKRLWNSVQEFTNDFKEWVNREGYWTNALPKIADKPDDPNFPIMKIGNGNTSE